MLLLAFAAFPALADTSTNAGFDCKIQAQSLAVADAPSADVAAGVYADVAIEAMVTLATRQAYEDTSFNLSSGFKVATAIDRYDKVMTYRM